MRIDKRFNVHIIRTVPDFVKTLCLEGHDSSYIMIVAKNTRWSNSLPHVRGFLRAKGSLWRMDPERRKPLDPHQIRRYFSITGRRL